MPESNVAHAEIENINWISMREAVDPRNRRLHRPMPTRDVPWVPTDEQVARTMLRFAKVTPDDVLYDLGCGDGRIVLLAARHFGCRAVGVDIDPQRIAECREYARRLGLTDRVTFKLASLFDVDIADATVVALYLLPKINVQLRPRLLWQLRPGTRIIANNFGMGDWEPDDQIVVQQGSRPLLKWIIPAWVQGTWKATIRPPRADHHDAPAHAPHFRLHLHRHYQHVTGTADIGTPTGPRTTQLQEGRLHGNAFTFRLPWLGDEHPAMQFAAALTEPFLRGHCHTEKTPEERVLFYATRDA